MRVYNLADELGITNEQLGDFLETIGEKSSHLANVSDEAAELAREHFVDANKMVPAPATDEDQAEFIETAEWVAEQTTAEAFAADPKGEAATTTEALDAYAEHLATQNDAEPTMPAEDTFHLVETGEEFCLDPTTAERLRRALKGRQLANACVHVDRCECIAVTWPCYQKITVRTDG